MKKVLAAVFVRSVGGLVRSLRFCGAALALHGMLLGLSAAMMPLFPGVFDRVGEVYFWGLAVPALVLTGPFTSILWHLGLMDAPGWFAWPKPLGIALAYLIWVAVLFGLAQAVQRWSNKHQLA